MSQVHGWNRFCLALCGTLALLAGCGRGPSGGGGGVAVLDLQRLAEATGHDQLTRLVTRQIQQQEQAKFNRWDKQIKAYLDREEANKGTDPAEHAKYMDQVRHTVQMQLTEQLNLAQQAIERARADMVNKFREQVRPLAMKVAIAAGKSVVLVQNESVLTFDPAVDITDQVLALMPRAASLPPGPGPELPQETQPATAPATAPETPPASGPAAAP